MPTCRGTLIMPPFIVSSVNPEVFDKNLHKENLTTVRKIDSIKEIFNGKNSSWSFKNLLPSEIDTNDQILTNDDKNNSFVEFKKP